MAARRPSVCVPPKRSYAVVPVGFDWHDFLALTWSPGREFIVGEAIRFPRIRARGLQMRCIGAGVSGFREPLWPRMSGQSLTEGSVTWRAEAITDDSLRTTITSSTWPPVLGLTFTGERNADLRYLIDVGGGSNGQSYEILEQVSFANGERDEGVILLGVED